MAYKLTPLGTVLATKTLRSDSPENAIIIYLYEHPDPTEVEELVGELHSDESVILRVLNRLVNTGYVKEL